MEPQQRSQDGAESSPSRCLPYKEENVAFYTEMWTFPRLLQALPEQSKAPHAFPRKRHTQGSWNL